MNSDTINSDVHDYKAFFRDATTFTPYNWQTHVAAEGLPDVLPVPTGLGKTEGVVLAWAWRRLIAEYEEPLHLVYCLPMRTLVRRPSSASHTFSTQFGPSLASPSMSTN